MVELKAHQQWEREQAVLSFMPDTDGTGSGSLLDSILFTLLKK